MERTRVLALVLVAVLLTPAVTTALGAQSDSGATTTPTNASDERTEYTRLYVDDQYRSVELKPGESETVNVTVENGENESVTLSPHLYLPPVGERPVERSWVTIEGDEPTLDAGEERTFAVTVEVPDDAEISRYSAMIAFTDEMISSSQLPERPVHSASISVEVRSEPTVTVEQNGHLQPQVQAGDTVTREIVVENNGDEPIPVNPTVQTEQHQFMSHLDREPIDESWFDVDAPNEIAPGETGTVEITVAPPESAERGRYSADIDLGLSDPARPDDRDYWQQINLGFQIWSQPADPFERTVDVANGTQSTTLTISTEKRPRSDAAAQPSFDVTFVAPNGTAVDVERVERTTGGYVDLGRSEQRQRDDSAYATESEELTRTYVLEEPDAGDWTVRIMPENAVEFQYEITRDEAQ
jgi:hypothetical protein